MKPVKQYSVLRFSSGDRRQWCSLGTGFRVTLTSLLWLLSAMPSLHGQQRPSEYQVKAAYLYNFGRFVEWPPKVTSAKSDPFTVCVLGQDPFGPALDAALNGANIAGKNVAAKRISNPEESVHCQILFLSEPEGGKLKRIIEALDKEPVLTVSDVPQFSQRGGMIQFVREGNNVRFEVNLTAAQHAGLALSSELLKVATVVRRDPATGD
jgi:hypothetical protein